MGADTNLIDWIARLLRRPFCDHTWIVGVVGPGGYEDCTKEQCGDCGKTRTREWFR